MCLDSISKKNPNASNNLIRNSLGQMINKLPKRKHGRLYSQFDYKWRDLSYLLASKKRDKIQQKVLTSLLLRRDRTVFPHFVKLSPINRVEVGHTLADASSASDLFCSSETHFLSIKDEKNGSKENPHERKEGIIFRSCYQDKL